MSDLSEGEIKPYYKSGKPIGFCLTFGNKSLVPLHLITEDEPLKIIGKDDLATISTVERVADNSSMIYTGIYENYASFLAGARIYTNLNRDPESVVKDVNSDIYLNRRIDVYCYNKVHKLLRFNDYGDKQYCSQYVDDPRIRF